MSGTSDDGPASGTRVVSLVPSVTETLSAWGRPPIACTRFCERPDLVHVGGTKTPDIGAIVDLRPDLVVLDRHENRREDADALTRAGVGILTLDVGSLQELQVELGRLAAAVEIEVPGLQLDDLPPLDQRVFVPIWRRPWMTIGRHTYGSSLLDAIGLVNVFADAPADYPEVTLDQAVAARPDVVLVPSEPYAFDDTHLDELEAVAPTVRVDGQDLFWWGVRTPAAIERLHARLAAPSDE
jgi:ABC-type Fe3+-hydroxamate transport system substrate-binding protein